MISEALGWRMAFLAIAVTGVIALIAMQMWLPRNLATPEPASFFSQFKVLREPRFLLLYAITAIGHGGSFVAFTFMSEILQTISGFSLMSVGLVFVCYGVGVTVGNAVCARYADRLGPVPVLMAIYLLLTVALLSLDYAATSKIAVIPVVILWGAAAFGSVPVLQLYVVQQAEKLMPNAKEAAASMNIAAFNVGIGGGAWLGGIAVATTDIGGVGTVAGMIVASNILLVTLSGMIDRRNVAFK